MKGRRGFTLIELLVVIAIIAILAAILFPVFARVRKTALNSDCQSNMKQIANAFKMYLGEWRDSYPYQDITKKLGNGPGVALSPTGTATQYNTDGTPRRFVSGTNWVEALFPYMEAISKDSAGSWSCKAAAEKVDGSGISITEKGLARVNYAMNINLVAQPEGIIKTASNMLLVREMDRKVNAVLRPINASSDGNIVPVSPFFTANDKGCTPEVCSPKQHSNGSNVMFADGHVKSFNADDMPDVLTATDNYDASDGQWFNDSRATAPGSRKKAIAITP